MPKLATINHSIKQRKKPRDVFITPIALAKRCINYHSRIRQSSSTEGIRDSRDWANW